MKKFNILRVISLVALVALSTSVALYGGSITPESVIHVVTIKWADDASEEKIAAALKGVETLAEKYEGITRVWTRSIKAQGRESGVTAAFVMEFKNEKALKDYAGSDAQKEWYETYIPVRDRSRTFDITN
tara:strand:- start:26217 stop:26606 length:390 start_codon:yes stop_codon:yes gene_type:complete